MKTAMLAGMLEATRLTRAGQVLEATAAIQRTLRGLPAAPAADSDAPIEGSFRVVDDGPAQHEAGASEPKRRAAPPHPQTRCERTTAHSADLGAMLREHLRGFRRPSPSAEPTPDQAPGVVPDGGRFIAASYTNHAGTRSYKLYIPSSYCGQPLPLVVMLHGCTQSPDDFAAGTRMNELAEEHQCFIAYPAQAQSANSAKCWNWFRAEDQRRDHGEPSIIAGITGEIIARYGVDERRVYVAGFSAGGAMAVTMAASYPDLYAAVGIHSGLAYAVADDLPSAFAAMKRGGAANSRRPVRAVPTIVFHGDRDRTVHPCNGDQVMAQSAYCDHAGAGSDLRASVQRGQAPNGHAYTRTTYHDASGQPIIEQWLIHGGRHAWSGGSPGGSYTDPKGPDASQEMMRFFCRHAQREASASAS